MLLFMEALNDYLHRISYHRISYHQRVNEGQLLSQLCCNLASMLYEFNYYSMVLSVAVNKYRTNVRTSVYI
jgi:hypothetical protein